MSKVPLSTRQAQVAELIAMRGLSDKSIALETGLAVDTVRLHIKAGAAKITIAGDYKPRERLMLWFFNVLDDGT